MATTLALRSCALSRSAQRASSCAARRARAEARARILRRIHGSPAAALQQALSDWRGGVESAGVVLALLDLAAEEVTARASVINLALEAVRTARDQCDAALEAALAARICRLNRPGRRTTPSRL